MGVPSGRLSRGLSTAERSDRPGGLSNAERSGLSSGLSSAPSGACSRSPSSVPWTRSIAPSGLRSFAPSVVRACAGVGACLALIGCTEWSPRADLEGPRVLSASLVGPRSVEVGVAEILEVSFSEPLDPESLSAGSVAIVPWVEVGRCDRTPHCDIGSCERGRCQVDPLSTGDLGRLDRGVYEPEVALQWSLGPSAAGPSSRLEIWPEAALAGGWRHSLILGGALRDRSGAPLVDDEGERSGWRRDFVTAPPGSSGPEAKLVTPASGELVPRNLARVVTEFTAPVDDALLGASLDLLGEDGSRALLEEPVPCAGWVPGYCLEWSLSAPLEPGVAYRIGGGSLRDRRGRSAVVPHLFEWFAASPVADEEPPDPGQVRVERRGGCVHAVLEGDEPLTLQLELDGRVATAGGAAGERLEVAIRIDGSPPQGSLTASLTLEDRAGNRASDSRDVDLSGADIPPLALVEVLANPAGREPDQEMVELVDVRVDGPTLEVEGLWFADLAWSEVAAALIAGDPPGRPLPSFLSVPGQRTVVVGDRYVLGDPADPDPDAETTLVVLDGSLGAGGLGNGGEPIVIYEPLTATLVTSYERPLEVRGAADQGRSAVNSHPSACDVGAAWEVHPLGVSSPGWAP